MSCNKKSIVVLAASNCFENSREVIVVLLNFYHVFNGTAQNYHSQHSKMKWKEESTREREKERKEMSERKTKKPYMRPNQESKLNESPRIHAHTHTQLCAHKV